MAFGLGFILGPALGGLLADSTVVSWFDSDTPFWFTAILTFLNILFVIFRFSETLKEPRESRVSPWTGIRNIGLSFRIPNLRVIFVVVLLLSLGFSFFTQFYSVYLITEFEYTEKSIGLLYGWIGIWLVITQGLIVRRLSNYFRSTQLLNVSILFLSLSIGSLLVPSVDWWFFILNPLVAIAQGITAPNMTAVVSGQAGAERQGEVLGINQSMQSLGQAVPPVIAGYIHALNEQFPLLAAAGLTFLGWIVYVFIFRQSKRK
ncbi:MAG: MFS transporter, partial [Phaeodactylibacter sp.]|nr:MFS transporter [Phaeodactylibacter sp.]